MQQNGTSASSASQQMQREADLAKAEDSDRYRDVGQIVDVINNHSGQARAYLDYLFQYGVNATTLQRIADSFKVIDASLAELQDNIRSEEAERIRTGRHIEASRQISDSARYQQAMQVYEGGNIGKARVMFASLSRYANDKQVRAYSRQCFDAIVQWENQQAEQQLSSGS